MEAVWERVSTKLARANAFDAAPTCLVCGACGLCRERDHPALVFCGDDCHSVLCDVDHHLALGLRRGASLVAESAPNLLAGTGAPPEVLVQLVYWAYAGRLHTLVEYDELLALRTLSAEFRDVVVPGVIARIEFLSQSVQRHLGVGDAVELSDFDAIRSLVIDPDRHYTLAVLEKLPALRRVIVRGHTGRESRLWRALRAPLALRIVTLHSLSLTHVPDTLPFEALALVACRIADPGALVAACAATLRSLVVRETDVARLDLSALVGLTELDVDGVTEFTGLAQLTSLTALAPNRAFRTVALPQLRKLDLRQRTPLFDRELVAALPRLETLYLWRAEDWQLALLPQLPALTTLGLAETAGDLRPLDRLTQLALSGVNVGAQLPPLLVGLKLDDCHTETNAFVACRATLRRLELRRTRMADPLSGLLQLRDLRVLVADDAPGLSAYSIQGLSRLRELYVAGPFAGQRAKLPPLDYAMLPQWDTLRSDGTTLLDSIDADEQWWPPGLVPQFSVYFAADGRF